MKLLPLALATTLLSGAAAAQPRYWHEGGYPHWHGGPWHEGWHGHGRFLPGVAFGPPVFLPPPVYVVPPPVFVAPRVVVRAPRRIVEPVVAFDPGPLLGAAVAPPVIVLPPPVVVADAAPPPIIPTPPDDALPITPPAVAGAAIPSSWRVGGFITAAYVTRPPVIHTVVRRIVRYVPTPYVVVEPPPPYPLPPWRPHWHGGWERPWHPHGWERGWRD